APYSISLTHHYCLIGILSAVPFFTTTATPPTHPLSLHDALPICIGPSCVVLSLARSATARRASNGSTCTICSASSRLAGHSRSRSEEHTSELQSLAYLVCRVLLEKKKKATQAYVRSSLAV